MYRIGEFAKLGGVSIKTLRYYDQIGLLRPAKVDARTQYRSYVPQQLQELASILALKQLGASLEEVKCVNKMGASRRERLRVLSKLKKQSELSLAAARRSLLWIEGALQELQQGERDVAVVLRERPALRVASIRAQAQSYDEIGLLEHRLRETVEPQLTGEVSGVLWHRCAASGSIEGEPFVEVTSRAERCGGYDVQQLPQAIVATAYCEPTERDAERVYDAMSRWVHLHDFKLAAPKREIYVGQILEVQFPVCAA